MTKTKIFITYKDKHSILKSDVITPIQTGRDIAGEDFDNILGDNTGDNISFLNESFCELSAIYWVWKNQDKINNPENIGFMHYRRHFLFGEKEYKQDFNGLVKIDEANQDYLKKDLTNDENIEKICSHYDAIIPQKIDITTLGKPQTVYEQYEKYHNINDYNKAIEIIKEKYPEYIPYVNEYNNSKYAYFLNMFVFKKEIFDEYCEWLFDIIFTLYDNIEKIKKDKYQQRVFGFISERLTGIFVTKLLSRNLKTKELPVSFIQKDTQYIVENNNDVIPVVVAASNDYVPILSTCLESIKEHSNSDYIYEINILEHNISLQNKNILKDQFKNSNLNLKFVRIKENLVSLYKYAKKRHYSADTFSRFFIPELLNYNKCIYLDLDMIILEDLKKLYNIDLEDSYIAAAKDSVFLNFYYDSDKIKKYVDDILKISNPENYFQAGVLVLNLAKLREINSKELCIETLKNIKTYYADQCVYNYIFKDKVKYFDLAWNYQTYHNETFFESLKEYLPLKNFKDYMQAFKNPKIIHYSGHRKPWLYPEDIYSNVWWQYATKTPFYEQILCNLVTKIMSTRENNLKNIKKISLNYFKCKLFAKITFGKTRKHYIEKENRLKEKISTLKENFI